MMSTMTESQTLGTASPARVSSPRSVLHAIPVGQDPNRPAVHFQFSSLLLGLLWLPLEVVSPIAAVVVAIVLVPVVIMLPMVIAGLLVDVFDAVFRLIGW